MAHQHPNGPAGSPGTPGDSARYPGDHVHHAAAPPPGAGLHYGGHGPRPPTAGPPHPGPPGTGHPPARPARSSVSCPLVVGIVLGVLVLMGGLLAGGLYLSTRGGTSTGTVVTHSNLRGAWSGTYTCGQGESRLLLIIRQNADDTSLTAVFHFSPTPDNPTGASGSFEMRGSLLAGSLTLRGDRWIRRPNDYEMVSLTARVSGVRPRVIRGSVHGAGCTEFTVYRRSS